MDTAQRLKLFQIIDSSLPTGSYAFSNGLEWMVKNGCISDLKSFKEYLCGIVRQIISFDLQFISGITSSDQPNFEEARKASLEYDISLIIPDLRKASIALGRGWLRLIPVLFHEKTAEKITTVFSDWGMEPLYLPVMSLSILIDSCYREEERSVEEICDEAFDSAVMQYVYTSVRDQIGAAIRLGVIGPSKSIEISASVLDYAANCLKEYSYTHYSNAVRTSVLPDVAVAGHSSLYTKLFQN